MTFSILIPAYKRSYLAEAVESVLAQTYKDFELIIVNDHSPEDLDSIVSPHLGDPRVHYYVNAKNCGAVDVVDNWICLSHASGDYVICMGDDDRLLPRCLEVYSLLIRQYPGLDLYHGWTELIDEGGQVVRMQEPRPLREDVYSMIWGRWHGRTQYIGDSLFRTLPLQQAGGFYKIPLAWGSDDVSAFRAAIPKGVANTQEPVFQYRVSNQTISRTGNVEMKLRSVDDYEQWCGQFLAQEPPSTASPTALVFWIAYACITGEYGYMKTFLIFYVLMLGEQLLLAREEQENNAIAEASAPPSQLIDKPE